MAELTVRPPPSNSLSSSADIFKVYLSPEYLVRYNLRPGDICDVYLISKESNCIGSVIVERSTDKSLRASVIQTSQALQALYQLKLGDKVSLTHTTEALPSATAVTCIHVNLAAENSATLSTDEKAHWSWVLQKRFIQANTIAPGVTFNDVEVCGETRSFRLLEVNTIRDPRLFTVGPDCRVKIVDSDDRASIPDELRLEIPRNTVGGLDDVLDHLDEIFSEHGTPRNIFSWLDGEPPRTSGILLHGHSGTGKSHVLTKIAQARWRQVYYVNAQTLSKEHSIQSPAVIVKTIFANAERSQPCVVLVDDLETIAPNQTLQANQSARSVASAILEELDRLHNSRVLVVAATRNQADIDQKLRSLRCLSEEIEVPIPNANARAQILKIFSGLPKDSVNAKLDHIASRTHGFVGADLLRLYNVAARKAKARMVASDFSRLDKVCLDDVKNPIQRTQLDYLDALQHVRPTAMREIFVETPQYGDQLKEYGIEQTNGLLLYGPPGCSKTMTAKAVATESGLNFIAVKGAELLNMFVGESERAIRELFAKARTVSPSIIFFDEIDAIGSSRDGGQHSGIHTVTTLLNELDGIDESKGVFVLAATNRPEVLDPALTRPGRLDTMIYVGPPDRDARLYILERRSQGMNLANDVDLPHIAAIAEGRSGAEMVDICQRAGKLAFRERMKINQGHFQQALDELPRNITPEMERLYKAFAASRR